jgi:Fe-S cluster assembly protein SufD
MTAVSNRSAMAGEFTKQEPAEPWLQKLRERLRALRRAGLPTTHDEEWRFTNVAPIARTTLTKWVTRRFSPARRGRPGVRNLQNSPKRTSSPIWPLRQLPKQRLRSAEHRLSEGGVFIHAAPSGDREPIELSHPVVRQRPHRDASSAHADRGWNPIASAPSSKPTPGNGRYFTNAVTEIVAGDHAVVDHYKCSANRRRLPRRHLQVQLGRSANFHHALPISLGGALVRNDIAVLPKARSHGQRPVPGERHAARRQSHRPSTTPSRTAPATSCTRAFWTATPARSSTAHHGPQRRAEDRFQADQQEPGAVRRCGDRHQARAADSADDVRCTHGATIGQLDAESLFYLQSRGIGKRRRAAC